MPPMPPQIFNPINPVFESVYTFIIIVLCFLVYFKTREIYELTKHKGIHYFRNAFLFFGLAYASRFFVHLILMGTIVLDFMIPGKMVQSIISYLILSYFSTLAILYLAYSTIWKKLKSNHFLIVSTMFALAIFALAVIAQSLVLISAIQFVLLLATIIISSLNKKDKKFSQSRVLYILLAVFWLINLFIVGPIKLRLYPLELILKIISLGVFAVIYYRVSRWIK